MPGKAKSYKHQPGGDLKNPAGSAGSPGKPFHLSPLMVVSAASVLTIVLLAGLGWHVWKTYLEHKGVQRHVFPIQALSGKIIHYDEVLTMSANMSAATGDRKWEKRYRKFEPQLDAVIKSLGKLVPETFDTKAAFQTDQANIKLVEMENQVFELADRGRLIEAQKIISGDDYVRQKKLYSDGMERLAADLEKHITVYLENHRKRAMLALVSILLALPLLATLWLWVLRYIRLYLKERYLVQQALEASEKKYRDFMEASPDPTAVINENGDVVMVNSRMEEMFGYSERELLEKTVEELMPERFRDRHVEQRTSFFADPVARPMGRNLELFALRKDGSELPVDISLGPLKTDEGLIVAVSIRDITERKKAENEIKKSKDFLQKVIDGIPDQVIVIDPEYHVLLANQAVRDFSQEPDPVSKGMLCYEIFYHLKSPCAGVERLCPLREVIKTGKPVTTVHRHFDAGENEIFIEINASPIFNDSGDIIHIVESCRDITDRKRADKALLDSELRFRDFFDNAPIGFHIFDSNRLITAINDSELEMIGYSRDEIIGKKKWADLIVPAQKEQSEKHWHDIMTKGSVRNLEYTLVHKQGHHIDVLLNASSRFDENGNLINTRGSVLNITERKQAEQEREQLVKTLKYKNIELQDIVYTASHDLKSPLVNIEGFSGELKSDCDQLRELLAGQDEDKREQIELLLKQHIPESLGFIAKGAEKMSALLDGLLQVSRVGAVEIHSESLDMDRIIKEILDAMKHQIKVSNITVTVDSLPGCLGDSHMLDHVFTNLISNAIKYCDPAKEGTIRISGKTEDRMSIYCVEDNGIGIAQDYQKKVFEIFHRLNPEGSASGEGLGLTIVTRILDRLEGEIWLESEPGKGSSFFVSLPRA